MVLGDSPIQEVRRALCENRLTVVECLRFIAQPQQCHRVQRSSGCASRVNNASLECLSKQQRHNSLVLGMWLECRQGSSQCGPDVSSILSPPRALVVVVSVGEQWHFNHNNNVPIKYCEGSLVLVFDGGEFLFWRTRRPVALLQSTSWSRLRGSGLRNLRLTATNVRITHRTIPRTSPGTVLVRFLVDFLINWGFGRITIATTSPVCNAMHRSRTDRQTGMHSLCTEHDFTITRWSTAAPVNCRRSFEMHLSRGAQ